MDKKPAQMKDEMNCSCVWIADSKYQQLADVHEETRCETESRGRENPKISFTKTKRNNHTERVDEWMTRVIRFVNKHGDELVGV